MNHILAADIRGACSGANDFLKNVMPLMPESRKNKIERYKVTDDKVRSAVCGLLLNIAYNEYKGVKGLIPEELVRDGGKPYIKDAGFYYSLSHSKEFCALIYSDTPCGIDIQVHTELKHDIAGRFFNEEEKELLGNTKGADSLTFDIWCLKEAVVKYEGTGLGYGFNKFSVVPLLSNGTLGFEGRSLYGRLIAYADGVSMGYVSESEGDTIRIFDTNPDTVFLALK